MDLFNWNFKSKVRRWLSRSQWMYASKAFFSCNVLSNQRDTSPIYGCRYNLSEERYSVRKKPHISTCHHRSNLTYCQFTKYGGLQNARLTFIIDPTVTKLVHRWRLILKHPVSQGRGSHFKIDHNWLKININLSSIKCRTYAVKYILSGTSCKWPPLLSRW